MIIIAHGLNKTFVTQRPKTHHERLHPRPNMSWLGILVLFYSNGVSSIHPYSPMLHCVHVFETFPQQQDYLQLY